MIKESDIKTIFEIINQENPLRFYQKPGRPKFVQGSKSDILKWPKSLCIKCNSTLTQPFDRSWSIMSAHLQKLCAGSGHPTRVSMARLFQGQYRKHTVNCQLYWIKHLGCAMNHPDVLGRGDEHRDDSVKPENSNAIQEVSNSFANSLIHSLGRKDVYLRFAYANKIGTHKNVGSSNLGCVYDKTNRKLIVASIIQYLGGFAVNVLYIREGYYNPAMKGAWNPLESAQDITFHTF